MAPGLVRCRQGTLTASTDPVIDDTATRPSQRPRPHGPGHPGRGYHRLAPDSTEPHRTAAGPGFESAHVAGNRRGRTVRAWLRRRAERSARLGTPQEEREAPSASSTAESGSWVDRRCSRRHPPSVIVSEVPAAPVAGVPSAAGAARNSNSSPEVKNVVSPPVRTCWTTPRSGRSPRPFRCGASNGAGSSPVQTRTTKTFTVPHAAQQFAPAATPQGHGAPCCAQDPRPPFRRRSGIVQAGNGAASTPSSSMRAR